MLKYFAGKHVTYTIQTDDDHPYYGAQTIVRIKCCAKHKRDTRATDVAASIHRKSSCRQIFYATLAEFAQSFDQAGSSLRLCSHFHFGEESALYKIMVALELVTRKRFDFPLPIPGGFRAAYNPEMRIIVLCSDTPEYASSVAKISESLAHLSPHDRPVIVHIESREINATGRWDQLSPTALLDGGIVAVAQLVFSRAFDVESVAGEQAFRKYFATDGVYFEDMRSIFAMRRMLTDDALNPTRAFTVERHLNRALLMDAETSAEPDEYDSYGQIADKEAMRAIRY